MNICSIVSAVSCEVFCAHEGGACSEASTPQCSSATVADLSKVLANSEQSSNARLTPSPANGVGENDHQQGRLPLKLVDTRYGLACIARDGIRTGR